MFPDIAHVPPMKKIQGYTPHPAVDISRNIRYFVDDRGRRLSDSLAMINQARYAGVCVIEYMCPSAVWLPAE